MSARRLAKVGALLLTASVATACGSGSSESSSSRDAADSAVIGVIGPKTGPAPQFWTETNRAIQLFAPKIEKQYGVHLTFTYADDAGTPAGASRAVQTVLNEDNVDAVMGPPQSAQALQVADVVGRAQRPWLLHSASNATLVPTAGDTNWAFRTAYNSDDLSDVSGQVLFAPIDGKDPVVGIIYSADAFGQAALETFKTYGEQHGVQVVGESMQTGATDFNSGISRLKAAGVDSLFINMTSGADIATVTESMAVDDFDPVRKYATANVLADYRGLASPSEWKGLYFIDPENFNGSAYKAILSAYKSRFGGVPDLYTTVFNTYAMLDAYAQAVKTAGSGDDYSAVRDALENLPAVHVEDQSYEKPFGPGDGELDEPDAADWYVMGFDDTPQGNIVTLGTVQHCIDKGC
ncbi:ABC transporter substrate-binding protein [Nocardioides acrostichi]|uniref:ABC transporter substrate-binding protein n=1 Tax=Nocardioides acrostichi TaxID=2784339 RepID=A0A930Y6C5_9ACTN|nr:ABC transporter substrate-binding protein [Nocardioides acrostichi]MBF4160791.1 ABC transporter substrate-binding protein [Nocardioides acrostichi]